MKAAVGRADRIAVRQRDGRLEDRDGVVRQRADGAAGEARHALGRLDPPARHEAAERQQRIGRIDGRDRQLGVVSIDRDGPVLDPRLAVADLEQPPRADAQERVPAQPLAALDGLEEVRGRRAVIEPEERPDRRLEVGGPRGAQEQRVGVAGEPLRLGEAERVRHGHVRRLRWLRPAEPAPESKRPLVHPGRKAEPSAVPPSFGDAALS